MKELELIRKQIEEILSIPQEYLMYRGGAGGEFLLGQIYKYSDIYKNDSFKLNPRDNNKFSTDSLFIHGFMTDARVHKHVRNTLTLNGLTYFLAAQIIDIGSEDFVLSSLHKINEMQLPNRKLLFRIHESRNSYFFNKTFLLFADLAGTWDMYWRLLSLCKVPIEMEFLERTGNDFTGYNIDIREHRLDTIIEYCAENNIKNINRVVFNHAVSNNLSKKEIHTLINTPLSNIITDEKINIFVHANRQFFKTINHNNYKKVEYINYFNKGYLEDIFEIDSNEFHDNLIQWHENNLTLLSKNGFNIEPYK